MTAISTTTLSSIASLTLQQFKDNYHNGVRTAADYYSELAAQGAATGNTDIQNYGLLAQGVVNNDTTAGQVANAYSQAVADDH